MRAPLNRLGVWLMVGYLFATTGCAAHGPGYDAAPPKVTAMISLLHSLYERRAIAGERYLYEVTIAPKLSKGSRNTDASAGGYEHRLRWCEDTIIRADDATVVEEVTRAERITSVQVDVYHWNRGRWVSDWELARERNPDFAAFLDQLHNAKLTAEHSDAKLQTQEGGRRQPSGPNVSAFLPPAALPPSTFVPPAGARGFFIPSGGHRRSTGPGSGPRHYRVMRRRLLENAIGI